MKMIAVIFLLAIVQTRSFSVIETQKHVSISNFRTRRTYPMLDRRERSRPLYSFVNSPSSEPQIIVSGMSTKSDLLSALSESLNIALSQIPQSSVANLCLVTVSSLYHTQPEISAVVSSLLAISNGRIKALVGCSAGGIIGSKPKYMGDTVNLDAEELNSVGCLPFEMEGVPACSVTLFVLPDVNVRTFHIESEDVPDCAEAGISPDTYKRCIGLPGTDSGTSADNAPALMLIPSPAFQNELDDFLRGLDTAFPFSTLFGGVASTVSSLSRARLFRYDSVYDPNGQETFTTGCIGVSFTGDIDIRTMVAQGAKPVGGIYRIVTVPADSSIGAIMLDENSPTEPEDDDEDDNKYEQTKMDKKELQKQMYAKARIPKPVLAEANFLMRTLSDDDQDFMRQALLVGIGSGGSMGNSPNELVRLSKGEGHTFSVYQVASASMKDGGVTLPLGTNIEKGGRMRFFVREESYARREVGALWNGYAKQVLEEKFSSESSFFPTGCIVIPTLDRGSKLFGGAIGSSLTSAPNFESRQVCEFLPGVSSVSGFYSNGALGPLNGNISGNGSKDGSFRSMCHGSASNYIIFGSKTKRPTFKSVKQEEREVETVSSNFSPPQSTTSDTKAPRDSDGELIVKRREIHSGRTLSVNTVEWSVAENLAVPSSALEGFMWDKETEIDRFRERVPLSDLVSQVKFSRADPTKAQSRNWVENVMQGAAASNGFLIIPECKRSEPTTGSLRKRYDVFKVASEFDSAGIRAFSVNCDAVLFGGSQEDITKARKACPNAPILASDLLLYPYQLYKLYLAGADAVNLVAGALSSKDMVYLSKIAKSIGMQCVMSVTSDVQLQNVIDALESGSIAALVLSNRNLENFDFDNTGEQALAMLNGQTIMNFREKFKNVPVLVEGRVGLIEKDHDVNGYVKMLKEAGACGAIVGEALAVSGSKLEEVLRSLSGRGDFE